MIGPEKNDVDISKLFQWGKELNLKDTKGNVIGTCYQRLVGDADMNRARVFALRSSADLRKRLHTDDSDERLAFIPDKGSITDENLTSLLLLKKTREVNTRILKEIDVPFPKELSSEATLEEQEKYQAEVDSYNDRVTDEIKKLSKKFMASEEERVSNLTFDQKYQQVSEETINELCEQEMYTKFQNMCIFFGTYKDSEYKVRLFTRFEEIDNLPPELKEQFIDNYNSLELDMDSLKK